ncbi:hypothetical protein CEW92_09140 [Bacillaceae bacterium SAS-127]|nr:hypothetical protein CEW92_09140 [Bacillaceae bacterium SAS-127]
MQMKSYRMLVMYVDNHSVNTGMFDNEIAVFERTLPFENEPPSVQVIHTYSEKLLASLDEEGMNMSKVQAICGPKVVNELAEPNVLVGMKIAAAIAERLHIPVFFVYTNVWRQESSKQVAYDGDPLLLLLAQQALLQRSSTKE